MFQSRSSTFHSFPPHNHTRGKHSFLNVIYHLFQLLVCKSDFVFAVQPMKLGEHLNSLLLNMCDDVTLSRISLRTVLDICSKHIRNSTCDPPFSYIRKLVRLVLGSLSQVCSLPWWSSIRAFLCFLFLARADSYVITVVFFLPSVFRPVFHPCSWFPFIFPFCLSHSFLSWMVSWLTGSLFQSAVRKFGRDWGAKVYHQVRGAALTHSVIPPGEGLD